MGPVDLPLVQAFEGPALVAVIVDDTARARAPENRPVDTPAGHAVEPHDLGHATLQRCRCAARPEIVLFGHVGVGVDHLDLVERESHVGPFVYVFCGKPRFRPAWLGSSHRLVTTFARVKKCTPSAPCACVSPKSELFQPPNE